MWRLTLHLALLLALATSQPTAAQDKPPDTTPRIGLVLSGGGARGLAHVGVLKVLERERVPIAFIAGTSMGAIVGGLYASGLRAADLERELQAVRWNDLFAARVSRQQLSQRRKEEDFEFSTLLELGVRDGELRTPSATVSSRGLEAWLRRLTLPVRHVRNFDQLPIPFRAVATDMETGNALVFGEGDLATVLRSSMSVPGVFAPTELNGRLLGDGGLVDNLPVDVARKMGADVLIVVNVGTPVAGRETLGTALGMTAQMINILTEQNVRRSIESLKGEDLLLQPSLHNLSAGDFDKAPQFIAQGEQAARAALGGLARLASQDAFHARASHRIPSPPPSEPLAFVAFEGSTVSNPQHLSGQLETKAGQNFNALRAERDVRRLAATGDYLRINYELQRRGDAEGLVFQLDDKPWGPNYLRLGLDMSTDFAGRGAFNLKLSHNRHWLTTKGTEWRNRLQLGEVPALYSEVYHPLSWNSQLGNDWFVSGWVQAERRRVTLFDALSGNLQAQFDRSQGQVGIDLGQPWAALGELRLGVSQLALHTSPHVLSATYSGSANSENTYERGARAHMVIDQLDFASFPQRGYRLEAEGVAGRRTGGLNESFYRLEARANAVSTLGAHTFGLAGVLQLSEQTGTTLVGRYPLGGFHFLSGYQTGQLNGNQLLFGRATWYRRLTQAPVLTRGLFVGATVEAGNVWNQRSELRLSGLRTGMSLFLGADTGIGPLYLGITHAPRGGTGLVLFVGRP